MLKLVVTTITCPMRFLAYPFDHHRCPFLFGSYTYDHAFVISQAETTYLTR